MGYNIHDVWRKDVTYFTRKRLIIVVFWLWYQIIIIFKNNTKSTRNMHKFNNSHWFKNDTQKNMSHIETTISNFYNNLHKISIKSSFIGKKIFWAKKHAFLVSIYVIDSFSCLQHLAAFVHDKNCVKMPPIIVHHVMYMVCILW
jgi:hypothetical protein